MSTSDQKTYKLSDKLSTLPDRPGVYLFKDASGNVIYVGKARSLRSRVRSYFTAGDDGRYHYPRLVASIRDLEVILTRDEVEALATEAAIIKLHSPRYNVDLRDDKSFPYLKVTREPFPRIFLTRKPRTPDGGYYGPFTDVKSARRLVKTLKGILQVRDCNLPLTPEKIARGRFKLCLDYHIGLCGGPCEGKVSAEEYGRGVARFVQFLHGRHDEIIRELEDEMHRLAADMRFEEAAKARDRLTAARRFSERQRKVDPRPVDRDAVGLAREDSYAAFSVIRVRGGRIVGQSPFHMERATGLDDGALMEAFLVRHYDLVDSFPGDVYLPVDPPDATSLSDYLGGLAGRRVRLFVPRRGEKRRLVETAQTNARHLIEERRLMADKRDFIPRAVKALQEQLHLPSPPMVIEAFDVSNLRGVDSVASLVTFRDGRPLKSGYRLFNIRSVDGIDDFAAIGEAVRRRYARLKTEIAVQEEEVDEEESGARKPRLPDLALIDGGAGQLSSARQVLAELGLSHLPVIGLAKRLEEIYLPGNPEPMTLSRSSSALRLLQQVRDEAHRFAITRHRLLRGKRQVRSRLDDIPGIGPVRRQELLRRFWSLSRIAAAGTDEIAATPGMNRRLAEAVKGGLAGLSGKV